MKPIYKFNYSNKVFKKKKNNKINKFHREIKDKAIMSINISSRIKIKGTIIPLPANRNFNNNLSKEYQQLKLESMGYKIRRDQYLIYRHLLRKKNRLNNKLNNKQN